MNRLERFVYDIVKDHPEIKGWLVRQYQRVFGLVPQSPLKSSLPVTARRGYFFGFHDKSPFSPDNDKLLAHCNLIGNRTVLPGDSSEVGFFSGDDWDTFSPVASTRAWDWQLGSMLQWIGSDGERCVFNDIVDGGIASRIVTTGGSLVKALPFPVVHVSPDAGLASSYCFRRVAKAMDGYGVRFGDDARIPIDHFDCGDPSDFRVFSVADGRVVFSVSLDEIREIEPHESMRGAFHFFHHSLFNHSGTRLFFFHRWVDENARLWSRMFTCNADGSDRHLVPTYEMVSHVGWVDDRTLLAYARTREGGDGYYLFEDGLPGHVPVAPRSLNSDGHPMMSPRGSWFVTDTYPDRFRNCFLLLGGLKSDSVIEVLRAHLPLALSEDQRVDLHPRFDRTGDVICFDSGHLGERSLCTVRVGGLLSSAWN
jgi:hypothetical protein